MYADRFAIGLARYQNSARGCMPTAMAVGLPHLSAEPRMPTVVPVGVASPSKIRAVDTWLYSDGIAVGVAQTAVSLSAVSPDVPTAEARRRPCEAVALPTYADGHTGGADGIYADGCHRRRAVPTVFLARPTA
jgi:hypothetical protein